MDIEALAKAHLKAIRPYKPGKAIEAAKRERGQAMEFVKLASNENPRPPHPKIREALATMILELNRYPESGCFQLVQELSAHLRVNPEEVFVGNGSNEIIDLLVRAFVHPDENVIFATPSFIVYELVCKIAGVRSIAVPCREFRIDLQAMAKRVNEKTKLVFICNPNNPTSTYVPEREVVRFLDSVPETTLVVVDEAYYEYVRADDFPDSLSLRRGRKTLVVLRTFSKLYSLAGIRVGYAVSHPAVVEALHRVRQPFNVNRLAQAAARAAITHSREIAAAAEETIEERKRVREKIISLGCQCPPPQTNFLYVLPPTSSHRLCERMMDHGVIVRDMEPFGGAPNSFRVTIGTREDNDRFIAALTAALAR